MALISKDTAVTPRVVDVEAYCGTMGTITPTYLPLYHKEEFDIDMTPAKLGEITPPGECYCVVLQGFTRFKFKYNLTVVKCHIVQ